MKKGQKFIASASTEATPTTTFEYIGINHDAPNPYNVMLLDLEANENYLVSWAWFRNRYVKLV